MKTIFKHIVVYIILIFLPLSSFALQKTWNGSVSSSWTNAGNWTPSGAPGSTDSVTIVSATNYPILTANTSVNRLTMTSGTLDMGGYVFTASQRAICNGGTISNGTISIRGSVSQFAGTYMNCKIDAITGQVKLDGSVFSDSCYFEQTGTGNSVGVGGNKFNGPVTIKNSGTTYYFYLADAAPDTFNV